ncbi:hypothetical protein AC622_06915 [Bacillus sp. FJAT-27916]|uniref:hypothetical protein n=1 Tax=Bacillus sp. FJAT-27916 TaxID=1679169 RepID=UPI00067077E2|nr:hypothetical protein [Bacillus sp. FJAT-27916]KMY44014.1 hypothetical protein AC622_06915 [Bacillus sp. FJAT-27916]
MTDLEYRQMVEKKYGMPLKDLMYEVCIRSEMDNYEAAEELGVPHATFMEWRAAFHLGPYHSDTMKNLPISQDPVISAAADESLQYSNEESLRGFEELSRQMLALAKQHHDKMKKTDASPLDRVNIVLWESVLYCLDNYKDGTLQKQYKELKKKMK